MRILQRMMVVVLVVMFASCASTIASAPVEDGWLDFPPQPRTEAMLLATIKFAFERNVFAHDAAYDEPTVTRLFGGESASFTTGSVHSMSGVIGTPGVCGSGGLCARTLRFARGVRPDGSAYSNVVATFTSSITADDVQRLLGVRGYPEFNTVLLTHRVPRPATAKGGNAILKYDLGRVGNFEVWYAPDATVESIGFVRNDRVAVEPADCGDARGHR